MSELKPEKQLTVGLGEERHLCLPCDPSDSICIYYCH